MYNTKINLNHLTIPGEYKQTFPLENHSVSEGGSSFESVEVVFKDIEKRLIEIIYGYSDHMIFGCVAWLTSEPILRALAFCKNVQILVQKEDFLRPDLDQKSTPSWTGKLTRLYSNIKFSYARFELNAPMGELSMCGDISVSGVRCVGNHNEDKSSACPRSHHKFLVFCKIGEKDIEGHKINYDPVALWTGSFNFTKNATYSFENAIFLTDPSGKSEVINAYLKEHHQIFCLSESLDWYRPWSEPEYRIGT